VDPQHFRAGAPLPPGAHVLVIDDTWVGGGHAQSAVLAVRQAGASHVSVLVLARWLNEDYGSNARFLADLADSDYNPQQCPWTGDCCP
jgi:adenine/guanine phosphoribosyltransferase-like PRPP-binding protein